MSKTIQQAIKDLDKFVEVYERDYEEWDSTYWKNGLQEVKDILKDVPDSDYDVVSDHCVADDPSGETYVNAIAYIEDGKPKLWYWVRENR